MTDSLPMTVPAPLTPAQRTSIVNLVRRAAKAEILPRFRALAAHEIDQKTGPQDLVTEADRAAEAMIARGLLGLFPNALIVGEEDVSKNPDIVDKIAGAEMAFTIDPVDGTWNYANGLTTFGVILSMTRYGTPVFGLLYDPVMDDSIIADDTGPAQMLRPRRAAQTLSVSKGGPIEQLTGYVGLYNLPQDQRAAMAATFPRFDRATSLRCACHEFRMLAQGNVDFVFCAGLTPWDHAAGVLIAQRAGGHVAQLDGSDYRADAPREGYILAASDTATWGRLRDVFSFLLAE
ncbi:inositol monophosphatase [Puniceibacterium sp. IMCC21224]|uniref:inositol monophosphatase family protein n=1 Tax=Puniceibacterium sp. IMCC21224 TaxID=1618204 RepID=UPI00064DC48C|nr:inositol monophosphatase [Puniceibacterium sp. IMCC21224]KMK65700.1 inositol monophosphatase/fructose-1,6-bisphosphatase family protein [Puniceibacterium sp. IMCC21224]